MDLTTDKSQVHLPNPLQEFQSTPDDPGYICDHCGVNPGTNELQVGGTTQWWCDPCWDAAGKPNHMPAHDVPDEFADEEFL
jgi:hypothetical protein